MLFKGLSVTRDASGQILLAPLLNNIRDLGLDLHAKCVTYFSETDKTFVFVGKIPVQPETTVEANAQNTVQIKLRSSTM